MILLRTKTSGKNCDYGAYQKLSNISKKNIIGAYCTIVYKDGTENSEIMDLEQIKQSWRMSKNRIFDDKGNLIPTSAHARFMEEACKKTVTNRACKTIINSSDDNNLFVRTAQKEQVFFTEDTIEKVIEAEVEKETEVNDEEKKAISDQVYNELESEMLDE